MELVVVQERHDTSFLDLSRDREVQGLLILPPLLQ